MEGNENFEKKNLYSKEKYIKRKQQKFLKWICPRLPNTRLLADFFSRRECGRTLDLRIDTLSQLLGHANLFPGGKYLIWDESNGFATGAILSRLGGAEDTPVVSLFTGASLQYPLLPNFNLTEEEKRPLVQFNVKDVGPEPLERLPFNQNPNSAHDPDHTAKHLARYEERQQRRSSARAFFDEAAFTSLILICDQHDPAALVDRFSRYLGPSGRLVVYCRYKEPLMAAFIQARYAPQPAFVDVVLTESWMRPYQTAAGRLHPEMAMPSSTAGFLLTGTRVVEKPF